MKTIRQGVALAALSVAMFMGGVSTAFSSDVTFQMRNSHPNAVEVELYSQDRDHVWPGNNQVYLLDDGETKQIPLSCDEGEKICYGAWVQGDKTTYWGTGPEDAETCDDCCYTCKGGSTEEIDLTE